MKLLEWLGSHRHGPGATYSLQTAGYMWADLDIILWQCITRLWFQIVNQKEKEKEKKPNRTAVKERRSMCRSVWMHKITSTGLWEKKNQWDKPKGHLLLKEGLFLLEQGLFSSNKENPVIPDTDDKNNRGNFQKPLYNVSPEVERTTDITWSTAETKQRVKSAY